MEIGNQSQQQNNMSYKQDKQGRFEKVAVIVWTVDPENTVRFLMRHNKPFNGYDDEWTITFGNVEENESEETAAIREASEEFSIDKFEGETLNLDYNIEYEGKKGKTIIHFFAVKIANIDQKIILNEESIGYDWMKIEKVKEVMQYDDEKKAFDKFLEKLPVIGE